MSRGPQARNIDCLDALQFDLGRQLAQLFVGIQALHRKQHSIGTT
jgi:hypothetical protein